MKRLCMLVLLLILYFSVSTLPLVGASSELWSRTYGGADEDHARAVVQTGDGGFALAGSTRSFGANFWLVKVDSDGNMIWNQTYGGTFGEDAYSLVETSDGGYAIAGSTYSFGAGGQDFWLVKTDKNGDIEWYQTYGGTRPDVAYSLVEASDGGYAITGSTDSFGAGYADFWLVKTDANGFMEWNRTYGGAGSEVAYSLVEASDGGYAIAGSTYSFAADDRDFWLVKTDGGGNLEWSKTYGGTRDDGAHSLIETSDGGYALAGYRISSGSPDRNFWFVKTDASGEMEWSRTYGGARYDSADSLVETSDDGYAIAGYTNSFGDIDDDFWLVKTDANGNIQWSQTYGGAGHEWALSLVELSDGGYVLAGSTSSYGAGSYDFWLVRTDVQGIPEFPSWIILPLFLVATISVIVFRKKIFSGKS